MSKERVMVLSVVQQGLTKAEAARRYQVSWRWVHTLVQRYQAGGLDAVEPRSRRPDSNSRAVNTELRTVIVDLRRSLTDQGLDAGPVSIAWHLDRQGLRVPSTSTIRRILHQAGLVRPEPKKRPKASLHRFAADQPNECWQSDFTHWQVVPDPASAPVDVEILNWLDDHSRLLLSCTALQAQLDTFTRIYNTERGHRALNGATPHHTYTDGVKATPTGTATAGPHYRIRYDHVDRGGKISLRRAGTMHHLGVGYRHAGTAVLITLDHDTATVTALTTGDILSTHRIDPDHTYWRNQQQNPGRWPRSDVNNDPTHL